MQSPSFVSCRRYVRAKRVSSEPELNMPGEFDFHEHLCIRWKKSSSLDFYFSDSPAIRFRNFDFKLRLVKPMNTSLVVMYIQHPVLDGVHEIETFLVDKNGAKFNRSSKFLSYDSKWCEEIWSIDRKVISSNFDNLVVNGMLNFVCIFNYPQSHCQDHNRLQNGVPSPDSSLEEFSAEISKLYSTGEDSDVTLQCGDRTILAHKLLLSARSDVFAAMFRNDMVECREGVIKIQDIEFPIVDILLRYIYSGKVDNVSGDSAVQLYKAADKYAVHSLKHKCASFIVDELKVDNACDALVLADLHSDRDLKERIISYLRKKQDFLLSALWADFARVNPTLAVEVYDAFVRDISLK